MSVRSDPPKSTLIPWHNTGRPWSRIHIDFAGPTDNNYYFIVTDSFSKWPEVFRRKTITSKFSVSTLREVFARFGLPDVIVSDNGTQFTSCVFQDFVNQNGIRHIATAVAHPASNGAAERSVGSFKNGLKAALLYQKSQSRSVNVDMILQRYLFDYRITPHITTGETPSKLMFGRVVKNRFDLMRPLTTENRADKMVESQIKNFRGRRDESSDLNNEVMVRDYTNTSHKQWASAKIHEVLGPRNYLCKLTNGKIVKRHVNQIIRCKKNYIEPIQNDSNSTHVNQQNCNKVKIPIDYKAIVGKQPDATTQNIVNEEISNEIELDGCLPALFENVTVPAPVKNCNVSATPTGRPKRKIVPPKRLDL